MSYVTLYFWNNGKKIKLNRYNVVNMWPVRNELGDMRWKVWGMMGGVYKILLTAANIRYCVIRVVEHPAEQI